MQQGNNQIREQSEQLYITAIESTTELPDVMVHVQIRVLVWSRHSYRHHIDRPPGPYHRTGRENNSKCRRQQIHGRKSFLLKIKAPSGVWTLDPCFIRAVLCHWAMEARHTGLQIHRVCYSPHGISKHVLPHTATIFLIPMTSSVDDLVNYIIWYGEMSLYALLSINENHGKPRRLMYFLLPQFHLQYDHIITQLTTYCYL